MKKQLVQVGFFTPDLQQQIDSEFDSVKAELADAGLRVEAKGIEFSLGPLSGQADQGAQGEQRPGPSRRAASGMAAQPEAEPPPTRALRGLLDLQI